jgi:hypothetical protein
MVHMLSGCGGEGAVVAVAIPVQCVVAYARCTPLLVVLANYPRNSTCSSSIVFVQEMITDAFVFPEKPFKSPTAYLLLLPLLLSTSDP